MVSLAKCRLIFLFTEWEDMLVEARIRAWNCGCEAVIDPSLEARDDAKMHLSRVLLLEAFHAELVFGGFSCGYLQALVHG